MRAGCWVSGEGSRTGGVEMAQQSGAVAVQGRVWVPLTGGQSPHWPVCPASAPWCVRASVSTPPRSSWVRCWEHKRQRSGCCPRPWKVYTRVHRTHTVAATEHGVGRDETPVLRGLPGGERGKAGATARRPLQTGLRCLAASTSLGVTSTEGGRARGKSVESPGPGLALPQPLTGAVDMLSGSGRRSRTV